MSEIDKIQKAIETVEDISSCSSDCSKCNDYEYLGEAPHGKYICNSPEQNGCRFVTEVLKLQLEEKQQREQGCEYCSGNNYRDRKKIPQMNTGTTAEIIIDSDNTIYVSNMDEDISISTIEINYCPMCGRRLSHE